MSPLALSLRFLQTQPDARLVELSRAGHERAFEALVQRYRRQLLAYCRRITSSEASAEDALQQALLQAWVALSTSDVEVREARAWLYRIVHNVAISNLRRSLPDAVEVDDAEGVSGADQEVERRLAVREALAGLASLPELQRRVMLSTALEGRSHDEIATALGLSHGAVRGLIYRARATLRAAAAVVTPAPLVHWAVRQQAPTAGRSAGVVEAIAAGGGGAGIGGVLLKGSALVVSAGALATAAGITSTPARHRAHHDAVIAASRHPGSTGAAHAAAAGAAVGATVATVRLTSAAAGASDRRGRGGGHGGGQGSRSGHGGSSGSRPANGGHGVLLGGSSHEHSGGGSSGGDGHGSGSGHGSGGDGRHSGSGDSGHRSGSDGGSGGDHHSGHDGSRTGTTTSGDGGSGADHGGGEGGTLSSTTTVTSTSGGTGDGGGGSGGDGGGTTTTVTTTSTTTSGSATSGD